MLLRRGQTLVEYTILIGIVTVVLFYMGTSVKRGVQSLVKVTADQVGNQENAEQSFEDIQQGYMQASNSWAQTAKAKQVAQQEYATNISSSEYTYSLTNTITNGGFTPSS